MKKLELQEMMYRAFEVLPVAVFWFDQNADIFYVNEEACSRWGYDKKAFVEMSIFDVNPNVNANMWSKHWELKIQDPSIFESSHIDSNGKEFPVSVADTFITYKGETYSCAIIQDISESKNHNRASRLSDFTIQNLNDAVFWLNPQGTILNVNEEAIQRYGYSREEILNMNILEIARNVDPDGFDKIWNALRSEKHFSLETLHYKKEGAKIDVEINSYLLEFEGEEMACSIVSDISVRKRKESALRGALMEVRELKEKVEEEKNYLQKEIERHQVGEIVSVSEAYNKILEQVEHVASTDSPVLIQGEHGTGKNLLGQTVHDLSDRNNLPFIKVDCSLVDQQELEQEIFGFAKGAFHGSKQKSIGKLQLVDGGTLLLDKIDKLSLDLQNRLLSVFRNRSYHSIGSSKTIPFNARILATAAIQLEELVQKGAFEEELYYMLNVFTINNIPLRERKEDIPELTRYFTKKIGYRLGKRINNVPQKTIKKLTSYHYPGNVTELENIIERGIIMSKSWRLTIGDWFDPKAQNIKGNFLSMEDLQRQHILNVLNHTNWKISGDNGAAEILKMKSTTLRSRMEKLGIQ